MSDRFESARRSHNDLFNTPAADKFEEFWQAYPRKVAVGAARKAYAKALARTQHDEIMFGLSQQLPAMQAKEKQYIPHAATWLNQERYDDDPEPAHVSQADPHADATARQINVASRANRSPGQDCF